MDNNNETTFSEALEGMKRGEHWYRAGWNGKGLIVRLFTPELYSWVNQPFLIMRTVKREWVTWTPSQTDLLANDWIKYHLRVRGE